VKPDGVDRALVGRVFTRLEEKGFKLCAVKFVKLDRDTVERFYALNRGKHYFERSVQHLMAGPIVASVWEGKDIVKQSRLLIGSAEDPPAGTIRADWGTGVTPNIIHGSDCTEAAAREIPIFFLDSEVVNYERHVQKWIY
jgi:nucleoside-diphosphate kinase